MSPSAGALAIMLAIAGVSQATACTSIVYCSDGNAYTDDSYVTRVAFGNTCIIECNGNCCTGADNVCASGRFPVCADADDGSCDGSNACNGAGRDGGEVGLISGGSCVGDAACFFAGYNGGKIGSISGGSCVGYRACYGAGHVGLVGSISNGSCVRTYACLNVGKDGGAVGDISGSCVGYEACKNVGYENSQFGLSLESCCDSLYECRNVGCTNVSCPSLAPSLPESCRPPPPSYQPTIAPTTTRKCKEKKKWEFACEKLKKKKTCRAEFLCKWNGGKCGGHLFEKLCRKADAGECSKVRMKGKSICYMG